MKFIKDTVLACISVMTAAMLASCATEVVDAGYPAQKIYLPAAVEGPVYMIDKAEISTGAVPTPGSPYQFLIDYDAATFTVPMSVYRSGVDNKGDVKVDIMLDEDRVYDLILSGDLSEDTVVLPFCECPSSVTVQDGSSSALFNVVCDLDYLMDSAQRGKMIAFGVSISTDDRELNKDCSSVVFVIDTNLFDSL